MSKPLDDNSVIKMKPFICRGPEMKHIIILVVLCFYLFEPLSANVLKKAEPIDINQVVALSSRLDSDDADLIVKGKIISPRSIYLSMDTIERLTPVSFVKTNHWTKEKEKYTGVSLIALLDFLGLNDSASSIEIIADNDYRISIKISELRKYEYILSYKLNDKLYSEHPPQKNRGPLAIAINFDKHPELDYEIYKHQLVWFVNTMIVK